jgi:hypothetical protein
MYFQNIALKYLKVTLVRVPEEISNSLIYIIKVQKSTDFKSQEKRERKTGHACSWGDGGGQIGRKKDKS